MATRSPVEPSSRRIDFVVAGVQKAGTTTLDFVLREHPQLQLPAWGDSGIARKELDFFSDSQFFPPEGPPDYGSYHANWDWTRPGVLRGEVNPSYLSLPSARERLAAYSPDLRVICIVRNPVSRAYSAWNYWVQSGQERLSFHQALLAEDSRLADRAARGLDGFGGYGYRSMSEYASQLEALWRLVPRERTLVVRLETLERKPDEAMRQVTDFLGVDTHPFRSISRRNARLKFGDMHPETWQWLMDRLGPEIDRIEATLGWDCSSWRKPKGSRPMWLLGESIRRAALPFSFLKPQVERMRKRIGALRRVQAGAD